MFAYAKFPYLPMTRRTALLVRNLKLDRFRLPLKGFQPVRALWVPAKPQAAIRLLP